MPYVIRSLLAISSSKRAICTLNTDITTYVYLYLCVFNFSFGQLHVTGELANTYPETLQLPGELLHHLSCKCLHWRHIDYLQSVTSKNKTHIAEGQKSGGENNLRLSNINDTVNSVILFTKHSNKTITIH